MATEMNDGLRLVRFLAEVRNAAEAEEEATRGRLAGLGGSRDLRALRGLHHEWLAARRTVERYQEAWLEAWCAYLALDGVATYADALANLADLEAGRA